MIPVIGIMIGCYILTRMAEIEKSRIDGVEGEDSFMLILFSWGTGLVAILGIIYLVAMGFFRVGEILGNGVGVL